ncbi:MAG: exonuclease subunit SbcD [Bacteroidales bacterium]|nr:exonuclease subunit SbcD [Bacteroidales bacterium]
MKILHTSDWHLGHILYNDSQEEAQKDMLRQIANIVNEKKPDVLIIAGDVYDSTQPSTSVQQMFADAMVNIHQACNEMTIVCIAGNHDSGSKHMIFHTPWKALNVHMIGSINNESDLNDYIIEIEGKGFVVAVPYAADRFLPDDVWNRLYSIVDERNRDRQLPVVLTSHLAILGSDWGGHDFSSDKSIGGLNCMDSSIFDKGYDYVALGHIHRQQDLNEDCRICYAGTPVAVSFDEVANGHGLLFVECDKHGEGTKVTPISINNINPLVNIPADKFADWDKARQLLRNYPDDVPSLIRLNVEVEAYLPAGANDEGQLIVKDKACKLTYINTKRKDSNQQGKSGATFTTSEFKKLNVADVAKMWIESKGEKFDDVIKEMLEEVQSRLSDNNE